MENRIIKPNVDNDLKFMPDELKPRGDINLTMFQAVNDSSELENMITEDGKPLKQKLEYFTE